MRSDKGSDIQNHPLALNDCAGGSDLAAKRWGIVVIRGQLIPGIGIDCVNPETQVVVIGCIKVELSPGDNLSDQLLDIELEVAAQNGGGVCADGAAGAVIAGWAAAADVGIGGWGEGQAGGRGRCGGRNGGASTGIAGRPANCARDTAPNKHA